LLSWVAALDLVVGGWVLAAWRKRTEPDPLIHADLQALSARSARVVEPRCNNRLDDITFVRELETGPP
jgi:hypothetical protein